MGAVNAVGAVGAVWAVRVLTGQVYSRLVKG
jgi:hypothetical protein